MRIQITLTVPENKKIIAKGIALRPDIKKALSSGKVLLKGGTTVSAICEELCGRPLKISGRITQNGTMGHRKIEDAWHCAIIERGEIVNIDGRVQEAVLKLGKDDIMIIGANAFDSYGNAAMMIGRPLGGGVGPSLIGIMSQINQVIIAVGTEKMVGGNLNKAIKEAARSCVDISMGMAVGLIPLSGEIYTELDAVSTLTGINPLVIGRGGIRGGEGSTTFIVDGDEKTLSGFFNMVNSIKGSTESGIAESLTECTVGERCKFHLACMYSRKKFRKIKEHNKSR